MSTHSICFYGKLEKIITEISSNTPPSLTSLLIIGQDKGRIIFAAKYAISVLTRIVSMRRFQ